MKILYIGDTDINSTSFHRFCALNRLGHKVEIYDLYKNVMLDQNLFWKKFHYLTGYEFLDKTTINNLNSSIISKFLEVDLLWINGGELFNINALRILKTLKCPIILYNNDDPMSKRDRNRFNQIRNNFLLYDLIVVVREDTKKDFITRGAKNILRVNMSYDEIMHQPIVDTIKIKELYKSDVAFIGTWMRYEKRDEFLLNLIRKGINVAIWGDRWQKSPYWNDLKANYRGEAIVGEDYVAAIQGAKICLGLLSKGNRDLHTQRSLEIPYAGGLLCAERTSEHLAMYKEWGEAVFWSDVDECAFVCQKLLADDTLRETIRLNGMKRVRLNCVGNEDICRKILDEVERIRREK